MVGWHFRLTSIRSHTPEAEMLPEIGCQITMLAASIIPDLGERQCASVRDIVAKRTTNPARVIIRIPSQMRSRKQLLIMALVTGAAPTALFVILMKTFVDGPISKTDWAILGPFLTTIKIHPFLFIGVVVSQWSRVRHCQDLIFWAATTGFIAPALLFCLIDYCDSGSLRDVVTGENVLIAVGIALAHAIVATIVWYTVVAVNRLRGVRVVVQDATCCATCGFDLAGKASVVCPSCGVAFTLGDLRTSAGLSSQAIASKAES